MSLVSKITGLRGLQAVSQFPSTHTPLHLLSKTHLAFVPVDMQARHPPVRLKELGYRGSEATGGRRGAR